MLLPDFEHKEDSKMKQYCIFAVEKANPKNIYGVTEFHGGVKLSKTHVLLVDSKDAEFRRKMGREPYLGTPAKERFRKYGYQRGGTTPRYMRKFWTTVGKAHYYPCGRTPNEYVWRELKAIAERRQKWDDVFRIDDYDIVVCRANSKWCPVVVDFSERDKIGKMTEEELKKSSLDAFHVGFKVK